MQDKGGRGRGGGGGGGSTGEQGGFSIPAIAIPETRQQRAATALKGAYLMI